VPEEKEVPKVIISIMKFRNSPTDRDGGWVEGERFTSTTCFT